MKNCIKCGEMLSKGATFCPKCKTVQPKKKEPWKIILIVLAGLVFIGIIGSAIGGDNSNTNSDDNNNYSDNTTNKKEEKKDFNQSEIATHKDVEYSIVKVKKTQGSKSYTKPKKGNEFVKVTIKIENKSDEKISFNPLDWSMVNSNGVEDKWGSFTGNIDEDDTLSSGELNPGGKIEGILVWEQKKGDDNLKIRYYDNMFNDDYTFQFNLDK